MWIRDDSNERRSNKTKNRITHTIVNMTRRPERGRARGFLTLLQKRCWTFSSVLNSSIFMRRINPWGGTLYSCSNWFVIGIMLRKHSKLVLVCGIIPWIRTSTLSLGCLGGGRIDPSSLSFLLKFQESHSWYMFKYMSVLI